MKISWFFLLELSGGRLNSNDETVRRVFLGVRHTREGGYPLIVIVSIVIFSC